MKSRWIEHKGIKIFYQDFSNNFYNEKAVLDELNQVQEIVLKEPERSILVLSNFSNTEITTTLMPSLNESSSKTNSRVRKTAVLGIAGVKRVLGDLLSKITGQELMYFTNELDAKDWLIKD